MPAPDRVHTQQSSGSMGEELPIVYADASRESTPISQPLLDVKTAPSTLASISSQMMNQGPKRSLSFGEPVRATPQSVNRQASSLDFIPQKTYRVHGLESDQTLQLEIPGTMGAEEQNDASDAVAEMEGIMIASSSAALKVAMMKKPSGNADSKDSKNNMSLVEEPATSDVVKHSGGSKKKKTGGDKPTDKAGMASKMAKATRHVHPRPCTVITYIPMHPCRYGCISILKPFPVHSPYSLV